TGRTRTPGRCCGTCSARWATSRSRSRTSESTGLLGGCRAPAAGAAARASTGAGQDRQPAQLDSRYPWPQMAIRFARRMEQLGTEGAFEVLARARRLEAAGRHVVHLEIGEPDFAT